jgi:hypothetical protein
MLVRDTEFTSGILSTTGANWSMFNTDKEHLHNGQRRPPKQLKDPDKGLATLN